MHDELNAILRLYGEAGTEGDLPGAPTESEDLAAVKEALDRLPRQRPDVSVIDAVVAAGGEAARAAALGPIRAVYDEDPEPLVSERAEAEVAALASVKAALDALPPQRPDASVIDAVMAAASPLSAPAVATVGRAADRPAQRSTRRRMVTALSAVFAVVLVFGGGLWMNWDATPPQEAIADGFEAKAEQETDAPLVAEAPTEVVPEAAATVEPAGQQGLSSPAAPPQATAARASANRSALSDGVASADASASADAGRAGLGVAAARQVAPESTAPAGAPSTEALAPAFAADAVEVVDGVTLASEETLPLADGDEELQLLYLRVREMQAAQAGIGWDTPPVSLGAAPDSTPAATGWMQVRVQR